VQVAEAEESQNFATFWLRKLRQLASNYGRLSPDEFEAQHKTI
jgi:hypothetical protein